MDGPDGEVIASMSLPDAGTMPQQLGDPGFGTSTKRIRKEAPDEIQAGGNGLTGHDETSEDITKTGDSPTFTAATPGAAHEHYDPVANKVTFITHPGGPPEEHAAATLSDGRVLVCGGDTNANATKALIYDPAAGGAWIPQPDMKIGRNRLRTAARMASRDSIPS